MILFGHLGITLAAVRTADKTIINRNPGLDIDYRFVLLGALLPDIIDKCILFFLSNETFRSGRMFAHSLLFTLLLLTLGETVRYWYKKSWVLVLAACSFIHLLLDEMWKQLNIFFWPFYDFILSRSYRAVETWSPGILKIPVKAHARVEGEITWGGIRRALSEPYIYISEIVGALILLYFIFGLLRRKKFVHFLKTGRLAEKSKLDYQKKVSKKGVT